jgi:hypothetical protein
MMAKIPISSSNTIQAPNKENIPPEEALYVTVGIKFSPISLLTIPEADMDTLVAQEMPEKSSDKTQETNKLIILFRLIKDILHSFLLVLKEYKKNGNWNQGSNRHDELSFNFFPKKIA